MTLVVQPARTDDHSNLEHDCQQANKENNSLSALCVTWDLASIAHVVLNFVSFVLGNIVISDLTIFIYNCICVFLLY